MKLTRKRALGIGVLALLVALVMTPFVLRSVHLLRRRAFRRRWQRSAVDAVSRQFEDASRIGGQLLAVEKGQHPWAPPEEAWLRPDIIVVANGDWIVYRYAGDLPLPDRNRVGDLFIGKGSNGKWYYSTWHYCGGCMVLGWWGRPASLDEFATVSFAVEFDGKPDAALGGTWDKRHTYGKPSRSTDAASQDDGRDGGQE